MKIIKSTLAVAFAAIALVSCNGSKNNAEAMAADADQAVAEEVDPADAKLPFEIKDNVIFNENVPVVVDFYADWCGPCKQYAPTFEAVAEKYKDAACFVSLNADEYPDLCKTYEISSIPTTVFIMPGGGVLAKETGVIPEAQLETLVNQFIATSAGADMEI